MSVLESAALAVATLFIAVTVHYRASNVGAVLQPFWCESIHLDDTDRISKAIITRCRLRTVPAMPHPVMPDTECKYRVACYQDEPK